MTQSPSESGDFDGSARVLRAEDFNAVGDGEVDDGPAILAMVAAARTHGGPVRLEFAERRTYRIETGERRYVFWFDGLDRLEIDGQGSTFLLAPSLRMLHAENCTDLIVRRLNVDFDPLPFVEGTVSSIHVEGRSIQVALDTPAEGAQQPGPKTEADGEQDFYGMAWFDGPYEVDYAHHYYVGDVTPRGVGGLHWHVPLAEGYDFDLSMMTPGETRFTLPVPGIAHRYGPGHLFRIDGNDGVLIEDVEVWSAPWFAFGVFENEGDITFRRANVRPKPGSGRLTSSWRDAYHIKHNRGDILMESCIIAGCHDDAIHIAAHTSVIVEMRSTRQISIQQNFPLQIASFRPGDQVSTYNPRTGVRTDPVTVKAVSGVQETIYENGEPTSPTLILTLSEPLYDVTPGETLVWNDTGSNPRVTIRDCTVDQSCRFRGPLTIEDSDFRSLVWIYGDSIESPIPSSVVLRSSRFDRGRGNSMIAISLQGYVAGQPQGTEPAMSGFVMDRCVIRGSLTVRDSKDLRFVDTVFAELGASVRLRNARDVRFDGCEIAGVGPVSLDALEFNHPADMKEVRCEP